MPAKTADGAPSPLSRSPDPSLPATTDPGQRTPLLNEPPPSEVSPSSVAAATTVATAGARYGGAMAELQAMGFTDEAAVAAALVATGGNLNAAVERLLSDT